MKAGESHVKNIISFLIFVAVGVTVTSGVLIGLGRLLASL